MVKSALWSKISLGNSLKYLPMELAAALPAESQYRILPVELIGEETLNDGPLDSVC